ncbi:MAG: XRE family transcriptional regulator [Xanthomonadaceae bacterium]|nr:XRE family transcriptional regulator [Xanthomonadaceae bacterium]
MGNQKVKLGVEKHLRSKVRGTAKPSTRTSPTASFEPPSVGAALSEIRQQRGLSLDALARQSGVSKSMLSQIERNQTNPTVAIVWRLANALGVEMGSLIAGAKKEVAPSITLMPSHLTPTMRGADGKCELKILGPIDLAGRFEWYELTIAGGGALKSDAHEQGSREHLTVLSGSLSVVSGDSIQSVAEHETARYAADLPHAISNSGKTRAVAILVVLHPLQ